MSGRLDHDNSSYIQALFYFCFVCACYTEFVKVLDETGFAKTIPNHTRTEIQFIAEH